MTVVPLFQSAPDLIDQAMATIRERDRDDGAFTIVARAILETEGACCGPEAKEFLIQSIAHVLEIAGPTKRADVIPFEVNHDSSSKT